MSGPEWGRPATRKPGQAEVFQGLSGRPADEVNEEVVDELKAASLTVHLASDRTPQRCRAD